MKQCKLISTLIIVAFVFSNAGRANVMPVQVIYLSKAGAVSDAVLEMGSTTYGTDNTAIIQSVLDMAQKGPLEVIWDGQYSVTGLRIHSDTYIHALAGCGGILRPGIEKSLFENYDLTFNPDNRINKNIRIEGGIWNGDGLSISGVANRSKGNPANGLNCCMRFYGVENLIVRDVTILRPRTYAIHGINIRYGLYERCQVDVGPGAINMDGLHFDGNCFDCIIRDADLTTFDDGVGCNADDMYLDKWYGDGLIGNYYAKAAGPAARLTFENIRLHNSLFGVRILSGGSRVDDITIRGISGTTSNYGLVIDNYRQKPQALSVTGPGNIGTVVIEDYNVQSSGPLIPFIDQLACININAQIQTLIFRNTTRRDFTYNQFPTFRFTGRGSIRHVIFDGYTSLDTSAESAVRVTEHVIVDGPDIFLIDFRNVVVDRYASANASCLLLQLSGTINRVKLTNVNCNGINNIINSTGGTLNYIAANGISHTNAAQGEASFKINGTVSEIILSNYSGLIPISPKRNFLLQSGDGFGKNTSPRFKKTIESQNKK